MMKAMLLILSAALGYSIATIGMKWASSAWSGQALALLAVGFLAATLAEVVLMREVRLGELYLAVIAVEMLVVLGYAFIIGEGLSPAQVGGGALILAGLAVVAH